MLQKFLTALMLPLFTAFLTKSDYGIVGMVVTVTTFLDVFVTLGFDVAFTRFYFDDKSSKHRSDVITHVFYVKCFYPAILLVLSLTVVALIVLKVVPAFSSFYEQAAGAQLPLSTRVLVAVSKFAGTYFTLLVITVLSLAGAFWFWLKQPGNRVRFDRWTLSIPMLGSISQKFGTSQAARTLATLLGGGIPLVNAIDIASRSIQNQYLAHELQSAAQQVREGRALATSMNDSGAFPDVAIKMVEVGEQTGALQEMLNSLADFYDEEIETNLGRFITIIEPALLVIMGIIIAGLLLSLYMPLFQMSNALG